MKKLWSAAVLCRCSKSVGCGKAAENCRTPKELSNIHMLNRQAFLAACFTVSSSAALEIWRADRRTEYPGRVAPLDEQVLKKTAKWAG